MVAAATTSSLTCSVMEDTLRSSAVDYLLVSAVYVVAHWCRFE